MAGDKITAEQAARRLGITTRTLWRWVAAGKIQDAPRTGNYRMFWAADVDRLAHELRGVPTVADMGVLDVYARLMEAESWEDVDALKADMEAAICAHAEDKGPLEKSYRAACGMAATHPDEAARERWAATARRYGEWLGMGAGEVVADVAARARGGSYASYDAALRELEAAPRNPAWAIAQAARGR